MTGPQRADRCLAVTAERFDWFVEDSGLVFFARPSAIFTPPEQDCLTAGLIDRDACGSDALVWNDRRLSSIPVTPTSATIVQSQFAAKAILAVAIDSNRNSREDEVLNKMVSL